MTDEPQGGLAVPPHIAQKLFATARRAERARRRRRAVDITKLVVWCSLLLFSISELLPVADWRTLFVLLVYGVSAVGCFTIVRRLVGCQWPSGHVPSAKYVTRWDDGLLRVGRRGKGVE